MNQYEHAKAAVAGVVLGLTLLGSGPSAAHQALPPGIVARIPARHAGVNLRAPTLVEKGRRLFEQETFGGNGRTCASCHPPTNNFTLDVDFIKGLPRRDPLFVAEFDPKLAGLEIPSLLRSKGLICENLDGFDKPCVLRSVPHTLALGPSRVPDTGPFAPPGRPVFPLAGALGWAGDGSPGDGSLRNFAVGAVVQHFPKTLNRVEGKDFRLPTADELDAMEAFQLSLGRQQEMNLDPNAAGSLRFADATVAQGQNLFFNGAPSKGNGGTAIRTCSGCHTQAGAGTPNRNRATGAERSPLAPPCLSSLVQNGDGGFGQGTGIQTVTVGGIPQDVDQGAVVTVDRSSFCPNASGPVTFIGTTFFNPPPVVEAADTLPGFHNNIAETVEAEVAFYGTDAFNNSISGAGNAFKLENGEVPPIGAFLRAINALENIRSATADIDSIAGLRPLDAARTIGLAVRDVGDAIKDLSDGPVTMFPGLGTVDSLTAARRKLLRGLLLLDPTQFAAAKVDLARASDLMLE